MDIIINIFSGIGYLTVGIFGIMAITDKNSLMSHFFNEDPNTIIKIMVLFSVIIWPITIPIMLIIVGINHILLKIYKKKYKKVGQLKKIINRKSDKIYDLYCKIYNL